MKNKLLFVIDSLSIGGAEKSLISLLNMIDSSKYEVDLLVFKSGGDLEKLLPNFINKLPAPEYFRFVSGEYTPLLMKTIYYFNKIKTSIHLRINSYKKDLLHSEQVVFKSLEKILKPIKKKYDVAIAYSQGMPTYFVANKVNSRKKLAWINTDYVNTLYNKQIDYQSYKKIDKIIAVSHNTRKSVSQIRPEYRNKVEIMLDIIDPKMIIKLAEEYAVKDIEDSSITILTVGRLEPVKSYDKAIEVARLLKNNNYKFKWFVVGEGSERNILEKLIEKYELKDHFILIGKKINPYPYMKQCDLYVQTSIKEGFGLTVTEAKILKKPIVCTDFPTAREIINNNVDGLIVDHDILSIYKGIIKYIDDVSFQKKVTYELDSQESYSSLGQLQKFYELLK